MPVWTDLGADLPWLRGQGFHVAEQSTHSLVENAVDSQGFSIARAGNGGAGRFGAVATALRLPASAEDNLDALVDSLRELPRRWPGVDRLALLWPDADTLLRRDLLAWTQLGAVLADASGALWTEEQVVFETVFFVPAGYGADRPRDV